MTTTRALLLSALLIAVVPSTFAADLNFVHLAPFDPAETSTVVSLSGDENMIHESVRYGYSTRYVDVVDGNADFAIHSPPASEMIAAADRFNVAPDGRYTLVALGDGANFPLELLLLDDNPPRAAQGAAWLRVIHAAPFAPRLEDTALAVRNDAGEVVAGLGQLRYRGDSGFVSVLPGTYNLEFAKPETNVVQLSPRPISVSSGDVLTLYLSGDIANRPLDLLLVDERGAGATIGQPLAAVSGLASISGWAGYLALGVVLACFVGVKVHRREVRDRDAPRSRRISVHHVSKPAR